MKTTLLMAGLVAALAGTAALAQVVAAPDEAAPVAPEGTLPPELAGRGARGTGPIDVMGRGGALPDTGPLSIDALNADGDGAVTPEKVEARKTARFAQADAEGNGGFSAEKLVALDDIMRDEMRAAAQVTAIDDDGLLQAAEIEARTHRLQPVFARLDADGDGAIIQAELDAGRPARGEGPDGGRGPGGRGHGG